MINRKTCSIHLASLYLSFADDRLGSRVCENAANFGSVEHLSSA
jgi:hypothetical protein